MALSNELKKLGFSDNKAGVYLAALSLGSAPASEIAQKAKLKRTTTYKLLEELVNEGLVEIDFSTKIKNYSAQSPKELVALFAQKKENADKILPLLLNQFSQSSHQPTIRFHSGIGGIKKTFKDALETKEKTIYTFSPIKNVLTHLGPTFSRHYIDKRRRLGINRKALRQTSDKKSDMKTWEFYASDKSIMRQVRYLPPEIKFHTLIQIYDNKTSIISFEQDKFSFIIEDEKLADFMKSIFNLLWQNAKK